MTRIEIRTIENSNDRVLELHFYQASGKLYKPKTCESFVNILEFEFSQTVEGHLKILKRFDKISSIGHVLWKWSWRPVLFSFVSRHASKERSRGCDRIERSTEMVKDTGEEHPSIFYLQSRRVAILATNGGPVFRVCRYKYAMAIERQRLITNGVGRSRRCPKYQQGLTLISRWGERGGWRWLHGRFRYVERGGPCTFTSLCAALRD